MSLHIILGGADSEKTKYCFDVMNALYKNGAGSYMIVPDQFSYAAERTATQRFGGIGLNGIEVLTFSRIVFRIRQKLSLPDYLTPAGREILICRAVDEVTDDSSVFYGCSDKDGFIGVISELISEFKRYGITPDILSEQARAASNRMLADKLSDISRIYARYEDFIARGFSDSDNDLDIAAEFIAENNTFGGMTVIFDGFSDFLPQNMRVVEQIIKNAADVYVTLLLPENTDPADDTFDVCRATYSRLRRIARENGIQAEDVMLPRTAARDERIRFLLDNFGMPGRTYGAAADNMSVFYAKDPYSEAEYTASEIVRLVREEGLRFRDIAVLCGSMDIYGSIIRSAFEEYDIPYFTDEVTAVTDHPIITAVTAVFDIIADDWRSEDVFRYLRAGFIYRRSEDGAVSPICANDIDRLENYVLRWGIRGRRQWLSEERWQKRRADIFGDGGSDDIDEELDALRAELTAPPERLREKASGGTAGEKAAALFEFLEQINMPDGIEYEINRLREKGFMDEASRFEQVWELLVEAIEQIYVTMGEEKCSFDDFARYIRAGLSRCKIRIIPSSLDHTAVGTIDRSRSADVKELFIMGANFGMIPSDMTREGILSNRDREELSQRLAEQDLSLAPDTKKRAPSERFKIYRSLCSTRSGLHISYAAANSGGDALRPSQFVVDIMRMFPRIKRSDDMIMPVDTIQSARSAFRALMLHLDDGGAWSTLRRYFENDEEYCGRMKHILSSMRAAAGITSEHAAALFGGSSRSVTQFENYMSCPYSYFLRYGLHLYEREMWEVNGLNIGNLCHRIVQQYCEKVSEGLDSLADIHSRWNHLSDEESTRIISEIISAETSKSLENAVHSKGRLRSVLNRIRRTVYTSVRTINKALSMGEYAYSASEMMFDEEIGGARIRGFIDRVDIAESDGKAYIRIVDYKSGRQSFDIKKIASGLNLQLVTYAIAARSLYEQRAFAPRQGNFDDVRIGGILYNKIRDDIAYGENVDKALKERDKSRKMNGMVFADSADEARAMDISLTDGAESEFLPIKVNANGTLSRAGASCRSASMADTLIRHTQKCIQSAREDIMRGSIPIRPYRMGNTSPCAYCSYMEVCRFDPSSDRYREVPTSNEEAESIIGGEKE